ncbi:uncharacterized protein LOC131151842 isoform X2 [Malania oleifera]|uniref:uncharacterized protein LOC131151842 isoform X2 n=1 Tax=Malania oleifera TaxID=397392 RepID=UPI0025ADD646|nr:uncharacterized protein LOC131151842 isoform X2 [Malania oleifera]XP_057959275.1 uncharacterized protein LOC131151842 isoform X2 [Malania oleifera]
MEHSVENSDGTEIPKKSRSLDLQSIYKSKVSKEALSKILKQKRHLDGADDDGDALKKKKKKSRKEVSLSSFEERSRRSLDEVYSGGGVSSGSNDPGKSPRLINSISLSLDDSIVKIPKRRRGLVGRKKIEGSQVSKPAGSTLPSSGKIGNTNVIGKSLGVASSKIKWKKGFDEFKENRSSGCNSGRHFRKEDNVSVINNGDSSSSKRRRDRKKKKDLGLGGPSSAKEAQPSVNNHIKFCEDMLEDDEENLEQNAARMLSSRFDPNCTGFSSNRKTLVSPSDNGLSFLISSGRDFVGCGVNSAGGSESASLDAAGRVLRPRKQHKQKGLSRKRRHFYEILYRDLDADWVLHRRIKVFWPLDQSWYFGLVNDYDPERKLHHVKYDDRDEEWINLQNERFKLLLFPGEVPGKGSRKKLARGNKHADKGKASLNIEDDSYIGSYMDSEPIISWLARSSRRVKSAPFGVLKKQKTSSLSPKFVTQLLSRKTVDAHERLDTGSSEKDVNKLCSNLRLAERLTDARGSEKSELESSRSNLYSKDKDEKLPLVYYRRRFHKKEQQLCHRLEGNSICRSAPKSVTHAPGADKFLDIKDTCVSTRRVSPEMPFCWTTDGAGLLKLSLPLMKFGQCKFEISFPVLAVLNYTLGLQDLWLFRTLLLFHYGTVMVMWPMVHLEMLFVDNIVGLRFLLFEGCLKQAVAFIFLVLTVFHQPNDQGNQVDMELPVTSIRFKLYCIQDLKKQLVFAFYNFSKLKSSKWLYLDCYLKRNCMLAKQLPLSECTYDNIKALQSGSDHLAITPVSGEPSIVEEHEESSRCLMVGDSSLAEVCSNEGSETSKKTDMKIVSNDAACSEWLSCTKPDVRTDVLSVRADGDWKMSYQDSDISIASTSTSSPHPAKNGIDTSVQLTKWQCSHSASEQCELSSCSLIPMDHSSQGMPGSVDYSCLNGISVEINPFNQVEKPLDQGTQSAQRFSDLSCNMNDGVICSSNPTAPRSIWHRNRNNLSSSFGCLSHAWPDAKADFFRNGFGNGPKKPRTQVSYSLPFGGHDISSRHRSPQHKALPHKRIRRANEKRTSDGSRGSRSDTELSCDVNVLITVGDRGWREHGARVVLELADHNEWRLAVKLSGATRYSYKAHQFMQPGTTNRYTHDMTWKGGKDWILEFPDRSQWMLFKEMHEECYNRNVRAALVKNIPIPGVRLIEDSDDNGSEVPFVQNSPKYFRQLETDVDMAMDPLRILYDMDSDDEQWIVQNHIALDESMSSLCGVSEQIFEKAMDMLEKVAYTEQRDQFTSEEVSEFMAGIGPAEVVKSIHDHWRQKREKKGMPLVRQLQPPQWERYQQQVKDWERAMTKANISLSDGCQGKAVPPEKPPMFAFCLKPRGLEVPNKGSKQRSQKKLPVAGHSNAISGDQDAFGRRLNGFAFGDEKIIFPGHNHEFSDASPLAQTSARVFSPRDAGCTGYFSMSSSDASERNRYPKLHRNKSKKIGTFLSSHDLPVVPPYIQRITGKSNGMHRLNMGLPDWPSQKHYPPEGTQRRMVEQLDGSDLDEFRLRDASGAAQHARNMAKLKREKAQRLLYRADLAIHKAVVALMTAEAIKSSSSSNSNGDG